MLSLVSINFPIVIAHTHLLILQLLLILIANRPHYWRLHPFPIFPTFYFFHLQRIFLPNLSHKYLIIPKLYYLKIELFNNYS